MSRLSSLLTGGLLGGSNSMKDRSTDGFTKLRFSLETLASSRRYTFTPAVRAEVLAELYDAFWGPYLSFFVPSTLSGLPQAALLSQIQARYNFHGAGIERTVGSGRSCGHIFMKGESCYRCKDCALDDSCVMCSRCFRATNHESHTVTFYIAQQSGGCCDCGDPEAWRYPIECPLHAHLSAAEEQGGYSSRTDQISIPNPRDATGRQSIPSELWDSMSRTVAYALEYVLNTLEFSPDDTYVPETEQALNEQATADPSPKDIFATIVWNDEKHSFDEVARHLCDTLGKSPEEAACIVDRIDEQGRDVVDITALNSRILDNAKAIACIDIGVTVRRAYDTFQEQLCDVIIEWLLDLSKCRIGIDSSLLREVIALELFAPRRRELVSSTSNGHSRDDNEYRLEVENPSKLDWLFILHSRLWKQPRLHLKELYVSVLTLSSAHRLTVATHFARVYHRIIDSFLLVDREAETSIKYFALQLFTVPTVAFHIVTKHHLIHRLLAIIRAFFTNQIQHRHIRYPPDTSLEIDVDAFPFKSKRFMPVFSDLRYICHNESVQKLIAHDTDYVEQFAKTCSLFMCINPNRRAASNHVEYETDAWISVFNVTLSLSRVIKVFGEAFIHASTAQHLRAMAVVLQHIIDTCVSNPSPGKANSAPQYHDVLIGDKTARVVKFNVSEDWVSFHHSLHWLLAELLKQSQLLHSQSLRMLGYESLRHVVLRLAGGNSDHLLAVFDYPLRVLAMVAQIRTGLWVRNGFVIRGQLLHYRDFMLRELCYDQDLFLMQAALVLSNDPDTVLISIIDRFQLAGWFNGSVDSGVYDPAQMISMVEEFLYVIITLLSEHANPCQFTLAQSIRREIIHALAVGACPYTDLIKRVAERMVDDVLFDHVLRDVANFKPPEGSNDFGIYELKEDAYDEVNPFFYHYTRNKREEVELVLKARIKKQMRSKDPIIVPKPMQIPDGPFTGLPEIFESETLLRIIFHTVDNVFTLSESSSKPPQSSEAILDQAIHLTILAVVERGIGFILKAASATFREDRTLLSLLCRLHVDASFKAYASRVGWILHEFEEHVPADVASWRTILAKSYVRPDDEAAKRRAAKARQEAILRQMKAQQSSFAMNLGDFEDDESEESHDAEHTTEPFGTCIVCQENLDHSKSFGALGLVQPSRFLRKQPDGNVMFLADALQSTPPFHAKRHTEDYCAPRQIGQESQGYESMGATQMSAFVAFPNNTTKFGLHASVCSHMMHLDCFQVYNISIKHRHRAQGQRNHPECIARKEYICPLCKSLGNVVLPVPTVRNVSSNTTPFNEWVRSVGITILKSRPDLQLDSLQSKTGTGEFAFWAAQDAGYIPFARADDKDNNDWHKMLDSLMVVSKSISQQTGHLRERPEPEAGERGSGLYLPEDLVAYTISILEVSLRGYSESNHQASTVPETALQMIRGLVENLTRLSALHFRDRPDEGRDSIRQAIIKRLLPEWSRTTLTSLTYPLLLRDPLTILVETAAVAPEILHQVIIPLYYVCLARTVVGLVFLLSKTRMPLSASPDGYGSMEHIFGDVRMFCMSVVRQAPALEHSANIVFESVGTQRFERLLYVFTLPFLRRAMILCKAMVPAAFPEISTFQAETEYEVLLNCLGVPPLVSLPNQDTLKTLLFGWCSHYGQAHTALQSNCSVTLEYPGVYRCADIPIVLDSMFSVDQPMTCPRCKTTPVDAAICLICGTVCCLQSHCCRDTETRERGECNMHTRECGGAIGVYFLVKRCSLLYLYAGNGAFMQAPYLDVHGEMDMSMRRGRQQFLNQVRWEEIRKTWINHNIPTLVARKLESSMDTGGWETL